MANKEHSWDHLSDREAVFVDQIIRCLADAAWAQPLLTIIKCNGGLTRANKTRFFELRFGYALHQAGIAPRHEVQGEGQSTLDFGFTWSGRDWLVELMRLEETQAVRSATQVHIDEDGVQWASLQLSTNAEDPTESPEGETLKAGGEWVQNEACRMRWDGRLITGAFDERTSVRGAREARERVHLLGFVRETDLADGGFAAGTQFIANPHLFASKEDARAVIAAWPLHVGPERQ